MGLQYVGGASNEGGGSTISVSLTALTGGIASAAQAGDLVVLVGATRFSSNLDISATGYTEIGDQYVNGTYDANLGTFVKRLTAADTTAVLSWGGSPSFCAAAVHVWRGTDPTAQLDVTSTGAWAAWTGIPNAPSITSVTAGAVILAIGCAAGDSPGAPLSNLTAPSGMSNLVQRNAGSTAAVAIASYAQTSAGAYDPAAFGGGTSNPAASWLSVTMALRPGNSADPAAATHGHIASSPTIAAKSAVAPTAATHVHEAGQPALTVAGEVAPAAGNLAQTAGSPTVTGHTAVAPADAVHGHTSTQPSIAARSSFVPAAAQHGQAATSPSLARNVVTPSGRRAVGPVSRLAGRRATPSVSRLAGRRAG